MAPKGKSDHVDGTYYNYAPVEFEGSRWARALSRNAREVWHLLRLGNRTWNNSHIPGLRRDVNAATIAAMRDDNWKDPFTVDLVRAAMVELTASKDDDGRPVVLFDDRAKLVFLVTTFFCTNTEEEHIATPDTIRGMKNLWQDIPECETKDRMYELLDEKWVRRRPVTKHTKPGTRQVVHTALMELRTRRTVKPECFVPPPFGSDLEPQVDDGREEEYKRWRDRYEESVRPKDRGKDQKGFAAIKECMELMTNEAISAAIHTKSSAYCQKKLHAGQRQNAVNFFADLAKEARKTPGKRPNRSTQTPSSNTGTLPKEQPRQHTPPPRAAEQPSPSQEPPAGSDVAGTELPRKESEPASDDLSALGLTLLFNRTQVRYSSTPPEQDPIVAAMGAWIASGMPAEMIRDEILRTGGDGVAGRDLSENFITMKKRLDDTPDIAKRRAKTAQDIAKKRQREEFEVKQLEAACKPGPARTLGGSVNLGACARGRCRV